MKTLPSGTWPYGPPSVDYPVECDLCGTPWPRSKMRRDGARRMICPDEGFGADEVTLGREEAVIASTVRERPRPPRDGRHWRRA